MKSATKKPRRKKRAPSSSTRRASSRSPSPSPSPSRASSRCRKRASNRAPPSPIPAPTPPSTPQKQESTSKVCSGSALLRSRGNALYKQSLEGGFCVSIQRGKLAHALQLYREALNASMTVDETASCYKNLGMLQWLFCKVELSQVLAQADDRPDGEQEMNTEHLSVCKYYLFDAVKSLSEARQHGARAKPQPWLDHLDNVMEGFVGWASEQTSLICVSHSPLLQYVSQAFESATTPRRLKLAAYRSYADALFKEALSATLPDETMDYKGCHSLLQDCCVPLRKAASCSATALQEERSLLHEVQELQDSVNVHLCICEAMQAMALGDIFISGALMDDEEMDMEKVKDALDYYRLASLATREQDMGTEALAMSKIGRVYLDVLKLPEEAHKYHFQALRLALTVMSPSIARAEWFSYCSEKVKAHQEKVAAQEEEKHEKDRMPAMVRLMDKIAALHEAADKGSEALLKHVYVEHPHPDLRRNVVPLVGSKDKVKASVKKAIFHYHPDSNTQYGEDWKVLCEEICKCLNDKYGLIKG